MSMVGADAVLFDSLIVGCGGVAFVAVPAIAGIFFV